MNLSTPQDLPLPGTGRALAHGWERMKSNALLFFLASLIIVVVDYPLQQSGGDESTSPTIALLLMAYALLFAPVLKFGTDLIFLRGVRGEPVLIKTVFVGFERYVDIILANLLVFGLIFIGFVALIIPGIYVACRLVFTSYLVMDEGLDPIAAVEGSWRMTKGHAWQIFWLGLLSILIFCCGIMLLIVGLFPALMWAKASFASLYLAISAEGAAQNTAAQGALPE